MVQDLPRDRARGMNYSLEILAARQQRDAVIEAARAEARRLIAEAVAGRDREIRRLRAQGLSARAIAMQIGCNAGTVYEVLNPGQRDAYNRRRREYLRVPEKRAAYNRRRLMRAHDGGRAA